MDLLKYLEPMKNLPDRFSNLAFWRGVRKLKDEVVNAFEYVNRWGENIENEIDQYPFPPNPTYGEVKTYTVDIPYTSLTVDQLGEKAAYIDLDFSNTSDIYYVRGLSKGDWVYCAYGVVKATTEEGPPLTFFIPLNIIGGGGVNNEFMVGIPSTLSHSHVYFRFPTTGALGITTLQFTAYINATPKNV